MFILIHLSTKRLTLSFDLARTILIKEIVVVFKSEVSHDHIPPAHTYIYLGEKYILKTLGTA